MRASACVRVRACIHMHVRVRAWWGRAAVNKGSGMPGGKMLQKEEPEGTKSMAVPKCFLLKSL